MSLSILNMKINMDLFQILAFSIEEGCRPLPKDTSAKICIFIFQAGCICTEILKDFMTDLYHFDFVTFRFSICIFFFIYLFQVIGELSVTLNTPFFSAIQSNITKYSSRQLILR